jgi:hypothetical protein
MSAQMEALPVQHSVTTTQGLRDELALAQQQIARLERELAEARAQVERLTKPVRIRDWWFSEARPIINAIGYLSVQEAMDAIERAL